MKKYPSTNQFRNAVSAYRYAIEKHGAPSIVEYEATVKLHGTNCGIMQTSSGEIKYQSRNNFITIDQDHYNFVEKINEYVNEHLLSQTFDKFRNIHKIPPNNNIIMFGEWCGEGIAKKVAISQGPKRFVIFGVFRYSGELDEDGHYEDSLWYNDYINTAGLGSDGMISHIVDYPVWNFSVDYDKLGEAQNKFIELVQKVEEQCPVAMQLGYDGMGEGIVLKPMNSPYCHNSRYWFKVKGLKHSASKVKTLSAVDIEKQKNVEEFVNYAVTENRLNQGIDYLTENNLPISDKSTGDYLRWLINDVLKEESDTMEASLLEKKNVTKQLSFKARTWFFNKLNELTFKV